MGGEGPQAARQPLRKGMRVAALPGRTDSRLPAAGPQPPPQRRRRSSAPRPAVAMTPARGLLGPAGPGPGPLPSAPVRGCPSR